MMKHREYPIALKQAAAARVAAGESVAEVARDLKLRGRLLYAWRAQLRAGGPAALRERGRPRKGAGAVAAGGEGELARAQRRVGKLERKIGQEQRLHSALGYHQQRSKGYEALAWERRMATGSTCWQLSSMPTRLSTTRLIHPIQSRPSSCEWSSSVAEVLNRRRRLSINMIRRLHDELGVSAEILIRPCRAPIQEIASEMKTMPPIRQVVYNAASARLSTREFTRQDLIHAIKNIYREVNDGSILPSDYLCADALKPDSSNAGNRDNFWTYPRFLERVGRNKYRFVGWDGIAEGSLNAPISRTNSH
jgi:transposase-like protein